MPKTFVIGDIHGGFKALQQCFERSGFDPIEDTLISLGDIADGWSEVPECVELLLSCKNLIPIKGNHDDWAHQWLKFGVAQRNWLLQGGQATYDAYVVRHPNLMLKHEKEFYAKQIPYYHNKDTDQVFVHGGYVSAKGIGEDRHSTYMWDRELWQIALSGHAGMRGNAPLSNKLPRRLRAHKEIFVGHTSTISWDTDKPMNACNVWNLDTGGGFYGKITIMDIDSKEYWQSDLVKDLYPEEKGR